MLAFYLSLIENEIQQSRFEELYRKYYIDTLYYAETLLHNKHDSEDVCQEAWLCIFQVFETISFKDQKSEKAYIMKTVRNKSINFLKRTRQNHENIDELYEELEANQVLLDEALISICDHETIEEVYRCLKSLGETYQDVMSYYYFDGFSIREIASMLEITTNAVCVRLVRGRKKLIKMLKKEEEGCNE